jgi:hypothetical protein
MRGLARTVSLLAGATAAALGACDASSVGSPGASAGVNTSGANATSGATAGGQPGQAGNAPAGTGSSQSGSANGGDSSITAPGEDAPSHVVTYVPSDAVLLNPERGFYATTNLVDAPNLSSLRASGVTLVHTYVRLDDYRTADIPASLLSQATAGFEKARQAGVKVILRFAYNFGPYPDSEPDAPKTWVLAHIQQLKPLILANADVIAVVQAGFIGAWGEWHSSTNDLTEPTTRQEILEALVDAVPLSRSVQLRYPPYKRAIYGDALTEADAFGPTRAARIGHHNDCFVSSADDVGTYPTDQIDLYRDYVGADTAFVPMGGETCAVSAPRSECPSALAEMAKLHFSYINREFHEGVLASWSGCMAEMQKRLGYRLALTEAELPARVRAGGSFTLSVALKNHGFAALFNARPVFVVLRGAGVSLRARLQKPEPRRWLSDGSIRARLRVPSTLAAGQYQLALWLPDAAPTLEAHSEYAIQLANTDVWDDVTGENTLGSIEVSDDAPGTAVNDAADLAVIAE